VLDTPLVAVPYEERLATLRARAALGCGTWSPKPSARGSLDAAILNPSRQRPAGLIETLPALRCVAFNGGTSAKLGARLVGDRVAMLALPSSSPAHAAMNFAEKAQAWSALRPYLSAAT
jgi:G:T/U-mismatch repair DNA glycosylase